MSVELKILTPLNYEGWDIRKQSVTNIRLLHN